MLVCQKFLTGGDDIISTNEAIYLYINPFWKRLPDKTKIGELPV